MTNDIEIVFGEYSSPANVSRLHADVDEATTCTRGHLGLTVDSKTGTISNKLYEPGLIAHDASYCTTVVDDLGTPIIPTVNYFNQVLEHFDHQPSIADIGCGQGEFVFNLRKKGIQAIGFDPVLRTETDFLHKRYWTQSERAFDLYVMRCVLPHISDPWSFLNEIWEANPKALVLVEYQRIEWMVENAVWNQICHDHVHQFLVDDFRRRDLVVGEGQFAHGEWQWVLLKHATYKCVPSKDGDLERAKALKFLDSFRTRFINRVLDMSSEGFDFVIWGGAAKGAMIADTMKQNGLTSIVVDRDTNRQRRYLEASGILVSAPNEIEITSQNRAVIVANPTHVHELRERFHNIADFYTMAILCGE